MKGTMIYGPRDIRFERSAGAYHHSTNGCHHWLNSNKGTKCDIESRATRMLAGGSTLQSPVSDCAGSIPHRVVSSPPRRDGSVRKNLPC